MTEYEDKLNSFAQRLKKEPLTTPVQEVRPIEHPPKRSKPKEKIVRITVHLPASLHKKVKLQCVQKGISFKDFVTDLIISNS